MFGLRGKARTLFRPFSLSVMTEQLQTALCCLQSPVKYGSVAVAGEPSLFKRCDRSLAALALKGKRDASGIGALDGGHGGNEDCL